LAASRALIEIPELTAIEVAKKAMTIAADTCIYTNHHRDSGFKTRARRLM